MSEPTPIFWGRVDAIGRLTLDRPADFRRYLRGFTAKPVELILRRRRAQRSHPQNRYYWGVVIDLLANELGYTKDELHEALKWQFLRQEDPDKPLATVKSTTALSTAEFETYLEQIRAWAATDLGIQVPEPHEVLAA